MNRILTSLLKRKPTKFNSAFTIVELVIVIVVIGILVSVTTVSYNAILNRSQNTSTKTDLQSTYENLKSYKTDNNEYPAIISGYEVKTDDKITYAYTVFNDRSNFCLKASYNGTVKYSVSADGNIVEGGTCTVTDTSSSVTYIQTLTKSTCPSTRIRVVDARDNRSYWVQKLADGNCWMLTNLAYAGGGTNTYGDTKILSNGTSDTAASVSTAKYYIPTGANPTNTPTNPSTSTSGTGQYGYLYNWCAAMGAQAGTNACGYVSTPVADASISVCPANWRLPTSGSGGEFAALNTAINSSSTTSSTLLRSTWLGQYSGYWDSGAFYSLGSQASYWSSTNDSNYYDANYLLFTSSSVNTSYGDYKDMGYAVRCIASQ